MELTPYGQSIAVSRSSKDLRVIPRRLLSTGAPGSPGLRRSSPAGSLAKIFRSRSSNPRAPIQTEPRTLIGRLRGIPRVPDRGTETLSPQHHGEHGATCGLFMLMDIARVDRLSRGCCPSCCGAEAHSALVDSLRTVGRSGRSGRHCAGSRSPGAPGPADEPTRRSARMTRPGGPAEPATRTKAPPHWDIDRSPVGWDELIYPVQFGLVPAAQPGNGRGGQMDRYPTHHPGGNAQTRSVPYSYLGLGGRRAGQEVGQPGSSPGTATPR